MIGAVIFIVVFLAVLGVSLGMPWLPPGYMIFDVLNIPAVDYPVLGIPAWLLIIGIVNGVVYGFIIWLIYSVIAAATGKGKKNQQISQTVNVQVGGGQVPPGTYEPRPQQ
ncbi:MAG: hypothetical protein QXI71_01995 [Candidatus Bathyarchaeia archaeon]|nr:hypothetical protein [Candidatus Bathyarchaeota archaeon]